jgi:hypothetical protein
MTVGWPVVEMKSAITAFVEMISSINAFSKCFFSQTESNFSSLGTGGN